MSISRRIREHVQGNPAEAASLGGLFAGAVALVVLAWWLPLSAQIALWALWLGGVVVVGRLFGPVLFYDLVRSARRLRFVVIRTGYALLIAVILCWMFLVFSVRYQEMSIPWGEMASFANNFFYTFLVIQFFTVVLLTPAYTAGAVAEEKERKTLEFILATDLQNREIVLGKVASRLLNLSLLLLAGVPILGFLQFLGGVDPTMVLAGFAATALTMFSLAGLSILNSVTCRRARDAIVMTYLMAIAYYMLAGGALIIFPLTSSGTIPGLATFPSVPGGWQSPVELGDLVEWLNAGNVGYAVFRLGRGAAASAVFDQELPGVLGGYAAFHALVGAACLGWAMLRLRVLALRENVYRSSRKKGSRKGVGRKPRVGLHPMIWKEVYAEGGMRLNAAGRILLGVLVAASFLPVVGVLWYYFDGGYGGWGNRTPWEHATEMINALQMRMVGTIVASLMLLAVVVRAAGSVRSEHERHTFDELLTTRLTNSEILFGKWLGAVLSVRWGWAWLGLIWIVSAALGGVNVLVLPMILAAWVTYAAVGAGVGLWFSVGARTTLRATVASLATMLFLYGGHWLLSAMCCFIPLAALRVGGNGREIEWMVNLQLGQTPPFVLGLLAIHGHEFEHSYEAKEMFEWLVSSLFGIGCWAAAIPVLWVMIKRRFEQETGRTAELRPERVTPRRKRPAPRKVRIIDDEPADNGEVLDVLPADEQEKPPAV